MGRKGGHAPGKRVQKVGKKGAKKGQKSCKKKVSMGQKEGLGRLVSCHFFRKLGFDHIFKTDKEFFIILEKTQRNGARAR